MQSQEILQPPHITIAHVKPSQIMESDYGRLGLLDLMREGYGFTEGLEDQVKLEYEGDDEERDILFAFEGDKVIGSLTIDSLHKPGEKDEFLGYIRQADETTANVCEPLLIGNIGGIVLHPSARGKGIAAKLLSTFIENFHPAIVVSQTKTPEYTATFSKTLAKYGFRTWYGNTEVTPEDSRYPEPFVSHGTINDAYARRKNRVPDQPYMVGPDVLPTYIPDVSRMSKAIQEAYRPVIAAQRKEHIDAVEENRDAHTAVLPCIAICVGN